jgi:hypothetical protein
MVFLRPKISHNAEQDKQLLNDVYNRAPSVKEWDEEGQRLPQTVKPGHK